MCIIYSYLTLNYHIITLHYLTSRIFKDIFFEEPRDRIRKQIRSKYGSRGLRSADYGFVHPCL